MKKWISLFRTTKEIYVGDGKASEKCVMIMAKELEKHLSQSTSYRRSR